MSAESTICEPEPMESEDPLFILYTSGSTGKPKGVQHSQAGYLLYAMVTHQVFFYLWKTALIILGFHRWKADTKFLENV